MRWHCFTATDLFNYWLICQVQPRLQLVSDKQEELMLLMLAPAFGGGRAVRKGGKNICVLSSKIWHSLKRERMMWERWVRQGTHNLPHWKLQIPWNTFLSFPAGRDRLCQSPARYSSACFLGWHLPLSRDLPSGVPDPICDILGSRMYLLLFSMLLNLSCLRLFFHLPKGCSTHCKREGQI